VLQKLQADEKNNYTKNNKTVAEKEELLDRREAIVELVFEHIEEVRQLDQRRGSSSAFASSNAHKDPVVSELPDIDDERFQVLRQNDKIMDGQLDDISAGVSTLKEIAQQMGSTANSQAVMLEDLDVKVDKVNIELENINVRLKKNLEQVRKADRFIVDIILLCVLLGLGGYIYSIAS